MPADLRSLDPDAVAKNLAEAGARAQELHPTLDLKRGPIHDLLLYPHAVFATGLQADVAGYLAARSLARVAADPGLADDATVDDILSNYRLARRQATAAAGPVTVVVDRDATLVLPAGMTWSAGVATFATTRAYVAVAEPEQVTGPGDRLITPRPGGGYVFTIDVEAAEVGAGGGLRRGVALLPASPPAGFVSAYAAADFAGGADAETNAELLERLAEGMAARGPSNRVNIAAFLRQFVDFRALSVVGFGDPEMIRDRHWPLRISAGGRSDWYVRTAARPERRAIAVDATLVGASAAGDGLWQVALGRDAFPGCYEIRSIRRAGADPGVEIGTYEVASDERGLDFADDAHAPDVETTVEGAYSRYQTVVARFHAPAVGLAEGATMAVDLELVGMPFVADIQAYASSRENRAVGGDCLVRAPVPCFVSPSLTLNTAGTPVDDAVAAAVRRAVADAVNAVGFTGRLFASQLAEAAAPYLEGARVSALALVGRIRPPGGGRRTLYSRDVLEIPELPAEGVGHRTVQFFCDDADVGVAAVASVPSS